MQNSNNTCALVKFMSLQEVSVYTGQGDLVQQTVGLCRPKQAGLSCPGQARKVLCKLELLVVRQVQTLEGIC